MSFKFQNSEEVIGKSEIRGANPVSGGPFNGEIEFVLEF
jgi:hypothetical protein